MGQTPRGTGLSSGFFQPVDDFSEPLQEPRRKPLETKNRSRRGFCRQRRSRQGSSPAHSDALVDCLMDRPETVLVCERDFDNGTQMKRLSKDHLRAWLENYTCLLYTSDAADE